MPPTVAPTNTPTCARHSGPSTACRNASSAAASASRSGRDSRRAVATGNMLGVGAGGISSGTSAASRQRPPCEKRVSWPIPQRPSVRPARSAPVSPPSAVTAPRPVTATWRMATLTRPVLLGDEIDQGAHRRERPLADLFIGNGHPEPVLDQDDQLERIDRVEPEAVAEDRGVVRDVARQPAEAEP